MAHSMAGADNDSLFSVRAEALAMRPGGVAYCDDCGFQACLKAGCCLDAEAEALGVSPSDLELALMRPVLSLPGLTSEELEALDRDLGTDKLSTGGTVIPHCVEIGAPPAPMPAGMGFLAPLKPCSGRSPHLRDGDP